MQMTPTELASLIVDYVRGQDFATFAGLAKLWPEHFDLKGEALALKSPHAPNVIIWYGISDLGADALAIARQRVELIACSPSSYLAAGTCLKLPLAKATSLKDMLAYTTYHWSPACLQPKGAYDHNFQSTAIH